MDFAVHEGRPSSVEAWRKVKAYREVDASAVHVLAGPESMRLVDACQGSFRDLVQSARVTGCCYGELTRMRVFEYRPGAGTVMVRISESGKTRHIALSDDRPQMFDALTAGRKGSDLIFTRDDRKAWGASHQQRPLEAAAQAASLDPAPANLSCFAPYVCQRSRREGREHAGDRAPPCPAGALLTWPTW